MSFLLTARETGRRNIMENGLHLLCPRLFGERVGWDSGFPRNSQPGTLSDVILPIDGRHVPASPCSGLFLHAKPGGSHPTPNTVLSGALTLLSRSQVQQRETQDNCPRPAKPRVACKRMEDAWPVPSGSPLRIILEFLNLKSFWRVSVFLTSHFTDRKSSLCQAMVPARGPTAP